MAKKKAATLDLLTLQAMVGSQHSSALAAVDASKLSGERQKAMAYYNGDITQDLPNEEGRSTAVSMDVADTIEGLIPQLMEVFAGGDEVVKFEPVGPDDVKAAEQETDYVNHVFMNRNPGFMVLYSIIKDALLQKVGIAKVWWEKHEKIERETYTGKTDDEFALLVQSPDVEVVEHTEKPDQYGQGGMLHDVVVETKKDYSCAKVMPVPPEEFGIDRDARTIKDANYCYHKVIKAVSDLIHDGYDEDQVRSLPTYRLSSNTEELQRDTVDEHSGVVSDDYNDAARMVEITEHYIRLDYRQNGKPELYRITTGGGSQPGTVGEILNLDGKPDVAPYDVMPFAAITPIPVTHRFVGRSFADIVMDIQRIKSAVLRGCLDNIYLRNAPRVEIAQANATENTIDDLLNVRRGGVIRTKTAGGLNWQVVPDVSATGLQAIEYMDGIREGRTGSSKTSQGIDADALQNQSATAVNQVYSAAQARVRLVARIFAETGIRDLFSLLHGVIKEHADKAQVVRLRNQWVSVDPRNWKTREDLTVHVGLGDGGKMQRIAQVMQIATFQKELLIGGKTNLVNDANLYNTAKELTKLLGSPNTDTFFSDPSDPKNPPPQPKPDPKMIEVQAKIQAQQQQAQGQLQLDQQKAQAQLQMDAAKHQADLEAQHQKLHGELQVMAAKHQKDFELEQQKMAMELQLKREQLMAEIELKREELVLNAHIKSQQANVDTRVPAGKV